MIAPLAILVTTLLAKASGVVELSDFFQFGSTFDTQLHRNDDEYSPPINISVTFTFFTEQHSTLFVNTNGLLSFYRGIRQYNSNPFPDIGRGMIVLAPFWADIDTRYCDSDCDIWYRESVRPEDLRKATSIVRQFFSVMKHFNATWTFVVTWNNVPEFGTHGKVGFQKRNTFQTVLITNKDSAFVIYYYNKIEWTGGTPAQVGFNMGDNYHYYSVEGSRTEQILQLPHLSNVDSPGTFAFRVDLKDVEPPPLPGDTGRCYFKATDIVFVVDFSLSIVTSAIKTLVQEVVDYLPINEYEYHVAMTSFSTIARNEFDFDDYVNKSQMLHHIETIDHKSETSNLEYALRNAKQMFAIGRGSRGYAKKMVMVFTDGLMRNSSELVQETKYVQNIAEVVVVAVGSSVQHSLLENVASSVDDILKPSPEVIWNHLKFLHSNPDCLSCTKHIQAEVAILLEDSSELTPNQFTSGKTFSSELVQYLININVVNVTLSIDVFGENVDNVLKAQTVNDTLGRKLGLLTMREIAGKAVNITNVGSFIKDKIQAISTKMFIVLVSSGQFLNPSFIQQTKTFLTNQNVALVTVGLGPESNWDDLEDLASSGYFVFDMDDAQLLSRHLKKEIEEINCT